MRFGIHMFYCRVLTSLLGELREYFTVEKGCLPCHLSALPTTAVHLVRDLEKGKWVCKFAQIVRMI